MNGDAKELLEAFSGISLERHKENLKKFDVITEAITSINERCFDRTGDFTLIKEHLRETDRESLLSSNRKFSVTSKLGIGLILGLWCTLISACVNVWMTKIN